MLRLFTNVNVIVVFRLKIKKNIQLILSFLSIILTSLEPYSKNSLTAKTKQKLAQIERYLYNQKQSSGGIMYAGKHLFWNLFLKKLQVFRLQVCNFINKRLQHRCFSVKFAKFLRTSISKINSERLNLYNMLNTLKPTEKTPAPSQLLLLVWIMFYKFALYIYSVFTVLCLLQHSEAVVQRCSAK